jgi:hypothetical protein
LADGLNAGRRGGKTPKAVRSVLDELRSLTSEIEDPATGGPAKRKAAARKAAATRQRNASKRSQAARAHPRAKAG